MEKLLATFLWILIGLYFSILSVLNVKLIVSRLRGHYRRKPLKWIPTPISDEFIEASVAASEKESKEFREAMNKCSISYELLPDGSPNYGLALKKLYEKKEEDSNPKDIQTLDDFPNAEKIRAKKKLPEESDVNANS